MEQLKDRGDLSTLQARQEALRLVIALYVMGATIGLWAMPGSTGLLSGFLAPTPAANLHAIALFGTAWFILVGRHLQRASLGLMGLVLAGAAKNASLGPADILLVLGLLMIAGLMTQQKARGTTRTGRIRLTRVTAPKHQANTRGCAPTSRDPFAQSPEDLACLFDQIAEAR